MCWGSNVHGELGDGTTTGSTTPVAVTDLDIVSGIAVGTNHSCARIVDGSVRCWGKNSSGQLGDSTLTDRTTPVRVMLP